MTGARCLEAEAKPTKKGRLKKKKVQMLNQEKMQELCVNLWASPLE